MKNTQETFDETKKEQPPQCLRKWDRDKAGIIATIFLFVGLAVAVPLLRVVFLLAAVALVV